MMLLVQAVPVFDLKSHIDKDETRYSHSQIYGAKSDLDSFRLPRYSSTPCACKAKRNPNTPELLKKISNTLTAQQGMTERTPIQNTQTTRRRSENGRHKRRPHAKRQLLFSVEPEDTKDGRQSHPHNATPDQIDRLGGLTVMDVGADNWPGVGRDLRYIADTMIEGQYANVSVGHRMSRIVRWNQDVRGSSSLVYSFLLMALLKSVCNMFKR